MDYRIEHDSMGEVKVPTDKLQSAQTQRSFQNLEIGDEEIPTEVVTASSYLKETTALTNCRLGVLDKKKEKLISTVCEEIRAGKLQDNFPLTVWQTDSGTQSNINVNEVITNHGNEIAGEELLHPNGDCNKSQSSNDAFPAAMHITAVLTLKDKLLPLLDTLIACFREPEIRYKDIVKSGGTHLQDAAPISFFQKISGRRSSLETDLELIRASILPLSSLVLGGTAVGTGLDVPKGFDTESAKAVSKLTDKPFHTAENKYHALTSKSELVYPHGALKGLAADLTKIANDIRWLSSGPRYGLGEVRIPENEPGSSIMPGKVDPTQCESVTVVAVQVMANDSAVSFAASQGNLEPNVFMPVMIYNYLQPTRLLADSMRSFRIHCCEGIEPNREKMRESLHHSPMPVTSLNPYIGYESAVKTAEPAFKEDISLKKACVKLGFLAKERFDEVFQPEKMVKEEE